MYLATTIIILIKYQGEIIGFILIIVNNLKIKDTPIAFFT